MFVQIQRFLASTIDFTIDFTTIHQVRPEKSYLIMDDSFATSGRDGATRVPFTNSRPLTCWAEEDLGIEICIAPVLVCSQV